MVAVINTMAQCSTITSNIMEVQGQLGIGIEMARVVLEGSNKSVEGLVDF